MKKTIWQGCLPTGLSMEQRFELTARAGFAGIMLSVADEPAVEVAIPYDPSAAQIKELLGLAEKYVPISDLWLEDQWAFPLTANDDSIRRRTIDRTKRTLEICADLGVESMLQVIGVVNRDHSYRTVWDRSQQIIHEELLPLAEKLNIQLNIETVWNKFMLSPVEFGMYLKQIDHPLVGAVFDVCNVAAVSYPWDWVEEIGPFIRQIHISGVRVEEGYDMNSWVGLLESNFDMREKIMQPLRDVGFDGWLTLDRHFYGDNLRDEGIIALSREMDVLLEA